MALTADTGFPLDKHALLALVEQSGDVDLLTLVNGLHDDHYSSADELEHRCNDALGVPDALPHDSALAPSDEWVATSTDERDPS